MEKLVLNGVKLTPNFAKCSFENLKNLKHLEYVDRNSHSRDELMFIKEIFQNTPKSVEVLQSKSTSLSSSLSSFVYGIKTLTLYDYNIRDYNNYFLFDDNLFPSLESICLKQIGYYKVEVPIKSFKRIKSLKCLKLDDGGILKGCDRVFNNLEEASLRTKVPESIENFLNLKKIIFIKPKYCFDG